MPQLARTTALRQAAVRAVLAPSVHNTQPWRLHLTPDSIEVHADWSRRLQVLDARGRQVLMSCGCALLNARVALAADGRATRVERFPDPSRPDLLARVVLVEAAADGVTAGGVEPGGDLARLDAAVDARRTNRHRFTDAPPPADLLATLVVAAAAEGTELAVLDAEQGQLALRLSREADVLEDATPGYRQELAAWTGGDSGRSDGVPATAQPARGADDPGPDTHGMGHLAGYRDPAAGSLLLLGTRHDSQAAWLRAGEAMERVLLELTTAGFSASALMQVVEVAETNARVRAELGLAMHPQALLRIGLADVVPATRRRRLVDVLTEAP